MTKYCKKFQGFKESVVLKAKRKYIYHGISTLLSKILIHTSVENKGFALDRFLSHNTHASLQVIYLLEELRVHFKK